MLFTIADRPIDIELIDADDAVLFWQNGVVLALSNNEILPQILARTTLCYVLNNDLIARGLTELLDKRVKVVDMDGAVMLTQQFYPQMKW